MLNTVYRLVEPRRFEAQFTDIDISKDAVLVRPTHLSICHADQRYYQGTRSKEILAQKLPMALIHEAIGRVEYDPEGEFEAGTYVVMVPNTPYETDPYIGENYLRSSKFRGSGFDGFMQDYVAMRRDRLVVLPEGINLNVAAFTEIVSVSYHAISRFIKFSHERRERIGIWGDGNLAFITSLLLKKMLPDAEVLIFGVDSRKMQDFVFADGTYDIAQIPDGLTFDHAFECVGNAASGNAINQIIDYIKPEEIVFVASDTHKLVRYTNSRIVPNIEGSFILPSKPAGILSNILAKETEDVKIMLDSKSVSFETQTYTLTCLFINGKYPNYNAAIPQNNPYEIIVDRVVLLNAIRRVAVFATEGGLIQLEIADSKIFIKSQDLEYSTSAKECVECDYSGEPLSVGFNKDKIIEILSNIDVDNIILRLSAPGRPGLFLPIEQAEKEDWLALLMPMVVPNM